MNDDSPVSAGRDRRSSQSFRPASRRPRVKPAIERVVDRQGWLAPIGVGAAPVATLRPDAGKPRQPPNPGAGLEETGFGSVASAPSTPRQSLRTHRDGDGTSAFFVRNVYREEISR